MPKKKHWVLACIDSIKWGEPAEVFLNGPGCSAVFCNPEQIERINNEIIMIKGGLIDTILKLDSVISIQIRRNQ